MLLLFRVTVTVFAPRLARPGTFHLRQQLGSIWSRNEVGKVRGKILLPRYSEQPVQGCCDVDAVLAVRFDACVGEGEEEGVRP